jgi:uncharacterized RmlC-like cupin family protein
MTRLAAITTSSAGSHGIWMGQTVVAPGTRSADHHHGASETAIFVVAGHPAFVYLEAGVETRINTSPGDYVYVPPHTPHREENPSATEEALVVIARNTQEAIVVNLPGLAP